MLGQFILSQIVKLCVEGAIIIASTDVSNDVLQSRKNTIQAKNLSCTHAIIECMESRGRKIEDAKDFTDFKRCL